MSGKLDQSLDEILKTQRPAGRGGKARGRGGSARRAPAAGRTAGPAAPIGGIKKNLKQGKGAVKSVPTGPAGGAIDSKIQVGNLPKDVNESQIKEYFVKSVGPIKRVEISYGPGGVSRGIATIWFSRPDGATKALGALNGLLVDGRPMKIEVILDARRAATIPPPKGLSERIIAPKSQPKSAAVSKTTDASNTRGKGRSRGTRGRNPRPTKKTAEELDSEMADYFDNGAAAGTEAAATNGDAAPQSAANVDAMDEEIL
ncbi:RNA recognition domain-containing protein [Phlyctema vagabunda]|uniref:RNA recognition domain-containing protein n=1 Tax=Phlyctema vagabunda TaxID=108571 RepID=A0ABR4PER0_9HELO